MKNLNKLMLAMVGCLAIVSCSDDDSDLNYTNPTSENLTGTYQLTSANAPSAQDYDNDGDSGTNLVFEGACYNDSWIAFHSDGTYDESYSSTTTGAGGLSLDCSTSVTSGTYARNGNTITTFAEGSTAVSATFNFDATTRSLTQTNSNGSYSAWNATTSLWATLTGSIQLTYTKYTDNDNDFGDTADSDGENDDENNANFFLLGDFNLTSLVSATAQNLDNDGDSSTELTSESSCYAQSHIVFNADGTYSQTSTTNVLGNLGLSITCNTETTFGTWTRDGNNVTTHRTSSGSGSVDVTYTFDSTTHILTRSDANGSYPSFSSVTSLFTMLTGSLNYTYERD